MMSIKQALMTGLLAFGTFIAPTAYAVPISPQAMPPTLAKPAAPYSLSLSSFDSSANPPRINVTITNTSFYTLCFFLESPAFTRFTVEYRSDMTPLSRWTMLKASLQPTPDVDLRGRPSRTRTSTYSVLITVLPGQQYETDDVLIGFPEPEGFYRITAVRAPEMDELSGSTGSYVLVRKFNSDVHSHSVVIRRVFNGFIEVPQ